MKILVIHNKYIIRSGEESVVEREAKLLRDHGHEVILWERDNQDIREFSLARKASLFLNNVWSRTSYKELIKVCRREKPDIAHFHNITPLISPSAYYACKEAGVPVVQTLHNYRIICANGLLFRDNAPCEECLTAGSHKAVLHRCYRNSVVETLSISLMQEFHGWRNTWDTQVDTYITPSNCVRDKILANTNVDAEKIVVKPHFIDDPGVSEKNNGYAVFLGRVSAEKGIKELVEAWEAVESMPLYIVGDGPELDSLKTKAAGRKNILFAGHNSQPVAMQYLRDAKLVILPSNFDEPFALTVLEAMACGKPIITTPKGGISDLVIPGKTGTFFTPGDANDLRQKIDWMLSNPDVMNSMGKAARKEYETRFLPEQNYRQLLKIYENARELHARNMQATADPTLSSLGAKQ